MVDDSQTIIYYYLLFIMNERERNIFRKCTFDFRLNFCHLTLFSPHSLASLPRLSLSTHRTEPVRVYFSLPTCLKLGVSEGRLDGISFELSFSDLFVLFSKLFFKVTSGK